MLTRNCVTSCEHVNVCIYAFIEILDGKEVKYSNVFLGLYVFVFFFTCLCKKINLEKN